MGEEAYQKMLDKYRPAETKVNKDNDAPQPRYTAESDSFETDPDPYEDITDEYLNED